jgi:4-hydroxybenzoate polyprenyltransferase
MSDYQRLLHYKERFIAEGHTTLNKSISFLAVSSILIAIAGVLKLYSSFVLYDIHPDYKLICASFFIIFSTYNLNKFTDVKEDSINLPQRTIFIERNKHYLIFLITLSYVAALVLCFLQNLYAVLLVLCPLLVGFIYSIKVQNFRLKDITGLKSISVGICWASCITLLPVTVYSKEIITICFMFYFFFIKSIISTILWDVRDKVGDSLNGVKTIPVVLGINKTQKLLVLLNSTVVLWFICCYLLNFFDDYLPIFVFSIVYEYWCIFRFCRPYVNSVKMMELFIHGEWGVFAALILLLNSWGANILSLVRLMQNVTVIDEGLLSCVSVWILCHFFVSFSLLSSACLIYAASKINKVLDVKGESRPLLNEANVKYQNK